MKTLFRFRLIGGLSALFLLAGLAAGCNMTVPGGIGAAATATTSTAGDTGTLSGPGGMLLTLEGEAVNLAPSIKMEMPISGGADLTKTPFTPASGLYRVSLDSQPFSDGITLAIPFSGAVDETPERRWRYAALVLTETSSPVLVGAAVEGDLIRMPIIGSGDYQVVAVPELDGSAFESIITQPLSVPSYPQMTPSWCSTTAITDLAGYHEGAWPAGGLGSEWGESSNWYLAGLGGQAFNKGYFFHWVLNAGGYSVPSDVKQSFTDGDAEVIIWDWRSFPISDNEWGGLYELIDISPTTLINSAHLEYANNLFDFFHSYVENQVWGNMGDRRPVAWGSSLAGHSRIITGSDGTSFFFNNPSSGSWNDTKDWENYRQEVIDSLSADEQEVIDTTVFYAPVRPAEDRLAVLWLRQANDSQPGSIVLKSGAEGTPAANWLWDGAFGHQYGYYYNDLVGNLPADPALGVALKSTSPQDFIEYNYSVRSISTDSHDYEVQTRLYSVDQGTQLYYGENSVSLGSGERVDVYPAGTIPIGNVPAGFYYLKFTLMMGGVTEDVKYVYFKLAAHDNYLFNAGRLKVQSNCRKGPGLNYEVATPLNEGDLLSLVSLNPERTWGLFDVTVGLVPVRCWVSLDRVEISVSPTIPIVTVVAPEPAGVVCSAYTTPEVCRSHDQCKWVYSAAGRGACTNK